MCQTVRQNTYLYPSKSVTKESAIYILAPLAHRAEPLKRVLKVPEDGMTEVM